MHVVDIRGDLEHGKLLPAYNTRLGKESFQPLRHFYNLFVDST